MRISPKEILVRNFIRKPFLFKGQFCSACNHYLRFERAYMVVNKNEFHCTSCSKSAENVYDRVFLEGKVTAQDVINKNERRQARKVLRQIIDDISSLPDGEVSPSVQTIILKHQISESLVGNGTVQRTRKRNTRAKRPGRKSKKKATLPRPTG